MVKCYACERRFDSNEEFYRHAVKEHGSIENAVYEIERRQARPDEILNISGFVEAEYDSGMLRVKKLRGVADSKFYIDVWNCHGVLHLGWEDEEVVELESGYFSVPKRIYRKDIDAKLANICFQVLEDRGGAINMSGRYYLDDEHIKRLLELVGFGLKEG